MSKLKNCAICEKPIEPERSLLTGETDYMNPYLDHIADKHPEELSHE